MKLNLGRDSEARFGQYFELFSRDAVVFGWDFEAEIWSRFVFEFVWTLIGWTQPFGPLSLWQCLHIFAEIIPGKWSYIKSESIAQVSYSWWCVHTRGKVLFYLRNVDLVFHVFQIWPRVLKKSTLEKQLSLSIFIEKFKFQLIAHCSSPEVWKHQSR